MKQFLLLPALLCLSLTLPAQPYPWDKNFFNHLAVGINAGTTGFGLDAAMPVCKYLQVRAGFAKMPEFKAKVSLDVSQTQFVDMHGQLQPIPQSKIGIQGKPSLAHGLVMLDILPILTSSFHLSVGLYFSGPDIVDIYNREEGALLDISKANRHIDVWNMLHPDRPQQPIGLELGDYLLTPDSEGNLSATISGRRLRPYAGVGFGRAVPRRRVGFRVDMGCLFWGKPKVFCNGERIHSDNLGGDEGKFLRRLTKMQIYPCLNFRLCGRIF